MTSYKSSGGWTVAVLCVFLFQSVYCTVGNYGGCSGCPESYSLNGTHNNQYYPYWGAAGTTLVQKFGTHFGGDGSGDSLPDYPTDLCCRTEPNFITQFEKASLRGLNQAQVIFGQFAWTHDLTNVLNNNADPSFQYESCLSFIHPRKEVQPGTNPRQIVNHATSFLDLGPIYGPSEEISAELRSFEGGKLLEDPYTHSLITDCELRGIPLDLVGKDPSEFLCAGDDRANENVYLTLITLMFVREHNRLADEYHVLYPHWNDDQLFCRARAMNIAQYQQISFYEWLPTVLGHEYFYSHYLQNYPGYDPHVNPGYFAESSASVFRFAHSMTPGKILRIDHLGEQNKVSLAAMANDASFLVTWGPEDWIRGISRTQAQNVGPFYPPELTDFDNPKLFDLHLFAADCFRSRDFGIWDYNTIRDKLGLPKVTNYGDITHSFINQGILFQAYGGSVDNLDLFIAGMLESYAPGGSIVGETFQKLIHLQAEVVRTGDRFWFENPDYKTLSQYEKEKAKSATLAKIFLRNSDIQCLQSQVMKMPTLSEKICKSPSGHIPV